MDFFSSAPATTNCKNCLQVWEFLVYNFRIITFYSFLKYRALLHTVFDLRFISLHLMTRVYLTKLLTPKFLFIYIKFSHVSELFCKHLESVTSLGKQGSGIIIIISIRSSQKTLKRYNAGKRVALFLHW